MANKAIIVGSSGLIGSKLLQILLRDNFYDEGVILVRKKLDLTDKKLKQLVVNFDKLDKYEHEITGHALFCCLGSTKAKTPDLTEYRKIDHDYPIKLATIAFNNGIKQFHLVSAIGANASSSNFILK